MAGMPGPSQAPPSMPYYPPPQPYPPQPYGMYYPPRPPGFWSRKTAKARAGFVVCLVGIVLLLVSILGAWWSVTAQVVLGFPVSVSVDFGLFSASAHVLGFGVTIGYDQLPGVGTVFLVTAVFLLIALLLSISSLVVGFVPRNPVPRSASAALGVGAGALMILASIYLMIFLPSAGSGSSLLPGGGPTGTFSGFWGASTITDPSSGASFSFSWGAGWAWYLSFAAAALVLVGGILVGDRPATAVAGTGPSPGMAPGMTPNPWAPTQPQAPAAPPQSPGAPPM